MPVPAFLKKAWKRLTTRKKGKLKAPRDGLYLHRSFHLGPWNLLLVHLDSQANVRLMDEENFQKYRHQKEYRYYGGCAQTSPVEMRCPTLGEWHLVIDLGGFAGSVRASYEIV